MENTVEQLKAQLSKAEEQRKIDQSNEDLTKNMSMKGKCFATHTFARKPGSGGWGGINARIRRINEVLLDGYRVVFSIETIEFIHSKEGKVSFDFQTQTRLDPRNWYEAFRYDITPEQYESIKQNVIAQVDLIGQTIRNGMKEPNTFQSNGDYSKEQTNEKLLLASGVPVIDLSENKHKVKGSNLTVREILSWQNHPMLISGNYLLNNEYSRKIVVSIADEMEKHARNWGSSIAERDYPRVEALREFVKSIKWKE